MRMRIGEYGNRRRDTLPYPVYVTNNKHWSPAEFGIQDYDIVVRYMLSVSHARAREKSLNFFAFRQQQMGNWPINCCDALGLPISAPSF